MSQLKFVMKDQVKLLMSIQNSKAKDQNDRNDRNEKLKATSQSFRFVEGDIKAAKIDRRPLSKLTREFFAD